MISNHIKTWFNESPVVSDEEVVRRIPTLHLIGSSDIREDVISLTQYAPQYFWERPGSYSGYHNGDTHGLWFHTLKLSSAIQTLKDTQIVRGNLTEMDIDAVHAAAILHDQWKNGVNPQSENTADNHASVAAEVASEYSELPYTTIQAIHQHMGPFDSEPDCHTAAAELVHTADMIASDDTMDTGVYGPVPSEIATTFNPHVIKILDDSDD